MLNFDQMRKAIDFYNHKEVFKVKWVLRLLFTQGCLFESYSPTSISTLFSSQSHWDQWYWLQKKTQTNKKPVIDHEKEAEPDSDLYIWVYYCSELLFIHY